jgi:alpha-D-ribose 1-methylphosphonate 5-triphosphate synthase subunit PhnH
MRLTAKLVGGVFALLLVIVLLQGVASETGEVVVLTTLDQSTGAPVTTRLWVVDHQGAVWLRGDVTSGWTRRVLAQSSSVMLERDGRHQAFAIAAEPAQVASVNQLMREKYGWRDQLISIMAPREDSVALRLTPAS